MPPAPPAPPPPRRASRRAVRRKSVTFCSRCERDGRPAPLPDGDVRYHSDPGRPDAPGRRARGGPEGAGRDPTDADERYYSEPDAKYFEIDYVFLKELRRIARNNCPECERRRSGRAAGGRGGPGGRAACDGRCRDARERRRPRSAAAPGSPDGRSPDGRSPPRPGRRRRDEPQSNRSVSFLESGDDEPPRDEPNYTATSFTNDLKKFLLEPPSPRLSLREKFIIGFKQELKATGRSPGLRAIKGLWKSY